MSRIRKQLRAKMDLLEGEAEVERKKIAKILIDKITMADGTALSKDERIEVSDWLDCPGGVLDQLFDMEHPEPEPTKKIQQVLDENARKETAYKLNLVQKKLAEIASSTSSIIKKARDLGMSTVGSHRALKQLAERTKKNKRKSQVFKYGDEMMGMATDAMRTMLPQVSAQMGVAAANLVLSQNEKKQLKQFLRSITKADGYKAEDYSSKQQELLAKIDDLKFDRFTEEQLKDLQDIIKKVKGNDKLDQKKRKNCVVLTQRLIDKYKITQDLNNTAEAFGKIPDIMAKEKNPTQKLKVGISLFIDCIRAFTRDIFKSNNVMGLDDTMADKLFSDLSPLAGLFGNMKKSFGSLAGRMNLDAGLRKTAGAAETHTEAAVKEIREKLVPGNTKKTTPK